MKALAKIFLPLLMVFGFVVAPIAIPAASAATPAPPAYGSTTCTFTITVTPPDFARGQQFTVTISGDCFGVTFTIEIHSTTDVLGTITTNSAGNGQGTFVAPDNLPDGDHTVTATSPEGSTEAQAVVVSGGPYVSTTPTTTSTSGLPLTGSDAAATAGVGALAVLVGGFLVLSVRRRRSAHSS